MVAPQTQQVFFSAYSPKEVLDLLAELKTAIVWRVNEFEAKADELECEANCVLFDRSQFEKVLQLMITSHNADIGISGSSVEEYLHSYCKIQS